MGLYLNPNAEALKQSLRNEIYVDKSMIVSELNIMWGAWSVEVGISPAASRIGPEVNEIVQKRSGDSEADRKAIKDGRIWWRWKGESAKNK